MAGIQMDEMTNKVANNDQHQNDKVDKKKKVQLQQHSNAIKTKNKLLEKLPCFKPKKEESEKMGDLKKEVEMVS